ncbi:MAG: class I SAM-dependent methyltransferase [Bacteroidetes bacterium]|nr:class I SAM-dependent methyltransferase [Bacteroidota bacterium]
MKGTLIRLINKLPYVRGLKSDVDQFKNSSAFSPGHFYSPLMDKAEIEKRQDVIWARRDPASIKAIDFNDDGQLALLREFKEFYKELPFSDDKKEELRYYYKNSFYSYSDAIVLYSMIRHFKPRQIIEVGSGFSSAVMLDTRDTLGRDIDLTFIEPYPDRLETLLTPQDRPTTKILVKKVQDVPLSEFQRLEANDILLIDSSHVGKTDSDLNYLLFEVIPSLNKGVLIHFHDILYPFEYHKDWVMKGFNWNEVYFVRALLMYNEVFQIRLFTSYMHEVHPEAFAEMPLYRQNFGGNLWLQKMI